VVFCGGSCDIRGEVSVCFRSMRDIIEDWMKLYFLAASPFALLFPSFSSFHLPFRVVGCFFFL
jgi:hypothetical protein